MPGKKTFTARTALDLCIAIYRYHGWTRAGESRTARVAAMYIVSIDHRRNRWVAKLRTPNDPPHETLIEKARKF